MASRRVALSTSFLLLAAGGTAACDSVSEQDEVFYCATEDGTIVDEDYCEDDFDDPDGRSPGGFFYLWHSPVYAKGLKSGMKLPPGGAKFAYNDRVSRASFGLPSTGRVSNGTIKTSVVGKGGSGSSSSGG